MVIKMKKLTCYEINDGFDGVVVAKSLKQAIKMLSKYNKPYKISEIMKSIKKCQIDYDCTELWALTCELKVPKKGKYKKSRIIGWCE